MDYLSTVRVLDTDYKIKDEEAARINHTHKVEEIKGAAKAGHQHQASEIAGLSAVATSGSYSDLEGKPSAATANADGLMTAADKKKLDNKVDDTEEGVNASLEKLPTWTAAPTDSTQLLRRDTGGTAAYGRVTFRTVWNYIKGKTDAVYAAVSHTHPYLPLSGGTLTGNVTAPKFVGSLQGTADAAKTATTASSAASAAKLAKARTVSISGAVSGSATWDGGGNLNISTTAKAPKFEYDSATGNLYYVTEE